MEVSSFQSYLLILFILLVIIAFFVFRQFLKTRSEEISLVQFEQKGIDSLNSASELYEFGSIQIKKRLYKEATTTFLKAVEYYQQALDLNSRLPQALNNIAVIYHYQGTNASEKKEFELAQNMFDKAGDYWKSAVRLAPNNYIEAQNWLKINGKMSENESF